MTPSDRLERLLAVQALDIDLASLEARREAVPHRRAEITREITELERERAEIEAAQEASRLVRRQKESEVDVQRERLAKYERQLNEVKTNVAYSALLSEIQRARREIAQLEDEVLERMAEREEQDRRRAELEIAIEEKRPAAVGALEALHAEERALGAEIEAARGRRDRLAAEVDPGLYRLYDRLRRARRFPALVPMRGQACGACHGALPPQIIREITHAGALHVCENCGVLVYVMSEGRPASAAAQH